MDHLSVMIVTGVVVYYVVILIVGVVSSPFVKDQEDYILGGRKLGPWILAFSERASAESAWLILGLPGALLVTGVAEFWTVVGCLLGIIASWSLVAGKLRKETAEYEALTLPEYLSKKFSSWSYPIRILGGTITVLFFVPYLVAQFSGVGKIMASSFGISYTAGVLIGGGVIVLYTLLGGFFAVATTDFVQGTIMLLTLILIPALAARLFFSAPHQAPPPPADLLSFVGGKTGLAAAAVVISGLSWGFGYLGQPHLLLRYMALKNERDYRIAKHVAFSWAIPAFSGAFLIGLFGLYLYGPNFFTDPEKLTPYMIVNLVPGWLAGVLIAGSIAAVMSTADSQLLVVTSSLTQDIMNFSRKGKGTQNSETRERYVLRVSKLVTFLVGGTALLLALFKVPVIYTLVSFAWSGLGSSFGAAILVALYHRKPTGAAVFYAMVTGSATTVIWKMATAGTSLGSLLPERLVSFVLALIVGWAVASLNRNKVVDHKT